MKVADMHCDTIGEIYENGLLGNNYKLKENNFHVWLNENLAKGNFKIITRIEYTRKLISDYNRIK